MPLEPGDAGVTRPRAHTSPSGTKRTLALHESSVGTGSTLVTLISPEYPEQIEEVLLSVPIAEIDSQPSGWGSPTKMLKSPANGPIRPGVSGYPYRQQTQRTRPTQVRPLIEHIDRCSVIPTQQLRAID